MRLSTWPKPISNRDMGRSNHMHMRILRIGLQSLKSKDVDQPAYCILFLSAENVILEMRPEWAKIDLKSLTRLKRI